MADERARSLTEGFRRLAKDIDTLRTEALFGDYLDADAEDLIDYDHTYHEAQLHFLKAVAELEIAQRSMELAFTVAREAMRTHR